MAVIPDTQQAYARRVGELDHLRRRGVKPLAGPLRLVTTLWHNASAMRGRRPRQATRRSPGAVASVMALALALSGPAAADHVGVLHLNGDRAGPYAVSLWTQAGPVRAKTACTVTVAVMRPETRVAVTDVAVHVTAARAGTAPVSTEAIRAKDPVESRYLADLTLPTPGRWTVRVAIQGPAGTGGVDFPLDVNAASWMDWLWWALGRS